MVQRPVGVSVPQAQNQVADQQQTRGAPKQLISIAKIETYGVQYTDDSGTVHTGLVHQMGDIIYMHPQDEPWAASIRTAANWLTKEVKDRITAHDAMLASEAAPEKPPVNVMPPKGK